jgi:DNA repair exonuclease SbcCD ATPase subunit
MDKKLTNEQLQEIEEMALRYGDPIRGKLLFMKSHIKQLTEQFNHAKDNYNRALMQDELSQKVIEQQAQEIAELKEQLPNIVGISGSFDGVTDTRKYTMPIGEYEDLLEQAQRLEKELEEWKRHYDKLLERKERLVKAIQNGEEIHFAVLDGEV